MLLVDTVAGRVIDDDELKETYANKQPYGEWLDRNLLKLEDLKIPNERVPEYTKEERQRMQKAFGYTFESLREAILPMAKNRYREQKDKLEYEAMMRNPETELDANPNINEEDQNP